MYLYIYACMYIYLNKVASNLNSYGTNIVMCKQNWHAATIRCCVVSTDTHSHSFRRFSPSRARSLDSLMEGHDLFLNQFLSRFLGDLFLSASYLFRQKRFEPLTIWDKLFMTTVSVHLFTHLLPLAPISYIPHLHIYLHLTSHLRLPLHLRFNFYLKQRGMNRNDVPRNLFGLYWLEKEIIQ